MSLFERLGGQAPAGNNQPNAQPNMQNALQQLRRNPVAELAQHGYTIPQGMTDPHQMVDHLIQSGQVPQNRLTTLLRMMGGR